VIFEHINITNLMMVALGGASFGVVFRIPYRYFPHVVLLAMIAKLSLNLFSLKAGLGFATFVATFIVGSISHLIARKTGKPAQAFLIPGVMFLVPGSTLYKSFTDAMNADYQAAMALLVQAIIITISISFALLLANWVIPSKRTL
jgi:uncharacterized membrane protein YjjB (DUF3815 family)